MTEPTRRLAAILAADVVGYSSMVGTDETGTLARVRALRTEVIEPRAAEHQGRLFKTLGDGFLLEFASAVQALRCAIAVQEALNADPNGLRLRIGIHQGEVVPDADDLFGDGVILAARLEPLADPGGIVVSSRVKEDAAGKMALETDDLGEPALKNIAAKIRAYRVRLSAAERPALALPDKPSLVVLPFQNMSGDAEQDYFADGMVEDITTALSRVRSLFVIARNSAFTYKGKAVDIRQVSRELGVRYVLEGSVRKAGNRVRITGQLIDATTGAHLWADRFDGALDDIFDLQDRVTASVAGAIEPQLERAEIERAQRKPTHSLDAHDHFLRGMAIYYEFKVARFREACDLFARAWALDPGYGAAYAMAAECISRLRADNLLIDPERETAEGIRLARLAATVGRDDATTLANAGNALAFLAKDYEAGAALTERARVLNPNSALAWSRAAAAMVYSGEPETGIACFEQAMRLSPVDPVRFIHLAATGIALLLVGRYDEAAAFAARGAAEQPNVSFPRRVQAAALALAGRLDEARAAMAEMRRLAPQMRLSEAGAWMMPFRRPEDAARYTEGLRLAGMPE
jgi:adenylate cyclase